MSPLRPIKSTFLFARGLEDFLASLHPRGVRYEFGVGVIQVGEGVKVGPVPGVEPPSRDVKVLLRHRPRSISQAQESA